MFLEAQNRREMAHFIAACGRAYTHDPAAICILGNENEDEMLVCELSDDINQIQIH